MKLDIFEIFEWKRFVTKYVLMQDGEWIYITNGNFNISFFFIISILVLGKIEFVHEVIQIFTII